MNGVIADPFMGGGTPVYEAVRLGFSVVGADVNPMAYWIVRQSLEPLDLKAFQKAAEEVCVDVEKEIEGHYHTECLNCGDIAEVKYFLWVKVEECPHCGVDNDLFSTYRLSTDARHPKNVIPCKSCGKLNEYAKTPTKSDPQPCSRCGERVHAEGPAGRGKTTCHACGTGFRYPVDSSSPPRHRMWAIEYHCASCKPDWSGRFFKEPDERDLATYWRAQERLEHLRDELPIPNDHIPPGDESDRLHRWGYQHYHEMFNPRQLLGLSVLFDRIMKVEQDSVRHALLTVFSDILRYQNMLCRYDTYSLKCQDIFSMHAFPVGLVQCENNVLGIPSVGSGGFRHFVEKYVRAKQYAEQPTERYTSAQGNGRKDVWTKGERIHAEPVDYLPEATDEPQAQLAAESSETVHLRQGTLDGVFTDPPYYDNVQYAELMDFCFAWLRQGLMNECDAFKQHTTRTDSELTGNQTRGRDLGHFTRGLSEVFSHYANALKPGAPFVFTYHHNDPEAYVPLVVAILNAGLDCTATLPAPAEMGASMHIAGTSSSIVDTVFVCRPQQTAYKEKKSVEDHLTEDILGLLRGGVDVTEGDVWCLRAGHVARMAINELYSQWGADHSLKEQMDEVHELLARKTSNIDVQQTLSKATEAHNTTDDPAAQLEMAL